MVMQVSVKTFDKDTMQREYVKFISCAHADLRTAPEFVEQHLKVWSWLETHVLANDIKRWVLVTETGEVVGHLAAVPQFYWINGHRIAAHTMTDFSVLPRYGFHALSLVRSYFRSVQNSVISDQEEEAVRILRRLGVVEVGTQQFALKALDVSTNSLAKVLGVSDSLLVPASIPRLLGTVLQVVDKALINTTQNGLKVEVLEDFDESFDELFEGVVAVVPCIGEKNAMSLRWHYGPDSPLAPVTVLGVRGAEGLLGYAVLKVTQMAPKAGFLLDLMTLPGRHDVAQALCKEAICRFRRAAAHTIRYWYLESVTGPQLKDLRHLGFLTRKQEKNALLVKLADRDMHETACNAANWSFGGADLGASCVGGFQPAR